MNMGHTYYQNHAHIVFHTGGRTIRKVDFARLYAYMATVAKLYKVQNPLFGGTDDHIHFLGNFPLDKAPSAIVGAIKANSSRWLKGINRHYADFAWQQGFGYFSVSASMRCKVVHYIQHQAEHHAKESAAQEYARLVRMHELASLALPAEEAYRV